MASKMMVSDRTGWVEIEAIAYKNALGKSMGGCIQSLDVCYVHTCMYLLAAQHSTAQHLTYIAAYY